MDSDPALDLAPAPSSTATTPPSVPSRSTSPAARRARSSGRGGCSTGCATASPTTPIATTATPRPTAPAASSPPGAAIASARRRCARRRRECSASRRGSASPTCATTWRRRAWSTSWAPTSHPARLRAASPRRALGQGDADLQPDAVYQVRRQAARLRWRRRRALPPVRRGRAAPHGVCPRPRQLRRRAGRLRHPGDAAHLPKLFAANAARHGDFAGEAAATRAAS